MYLHIKMTKLLFSITLGLSTAFAQVKIISEDSRIHVEIHGKPYADLVFIASSLLTTRSA